MNIENIDTKQLIDCYQLILEYLKQLETQKKKVSENNEGKN